MIACVVIPTYNERENIQRLVPALLDRREGLRVLVVDDNSPDGTADAVRALAHADGRVSLLLRDRKEGIGPAYLAGFRKALEDGADFIVQMDADFSHPVEMVPELLQLARDHDLVLGSRYLNGITVVNWPIGRLLLSYFGNAYARWVTGLPVADVTGGFKCWRRELLARIPLERVRSNGYAFQIEMTFRACQLGARLCETPILFVDRTIGDSKMNKRIALEALWIVWWLQWKRWRGSL
ncbi:MAG: dolichyl-phosphate beta-D-mannosyltransferase [Candidatus Binatia bacterium]|nr:MAG: dolichyl-phosphate beta-D-mannosyltransferase [Candidatus Binatia bacterium]